MKPWVKQPTDLGLPDLSQTSRGAEATFWRLWRIAARSGPIGALVDPMGRALSVRSLASRARIPRSTFHEDLLELQELQLVIQDLTGTYHVPYVSLVEQLFSPSPGHAAARGPEYGAPNGNAIARGRTVENGEVKLPGVSGIPDGSVRYTGPPHTPQKLSSSSTQVISETRENDTVSFIQSEDEEGAVIPFDGAVPEDLIPDSEIRHDLEHLARRAPQWGRMLTRKRDLASLGRHWREGQQELAAALKDARSDPGGVKNPAAWLNWKVSAIAEEGGER